MILANNFFYDFLLDKLYHLLFYFSNNLFDNFFLNYPVNIDRIFNLYNALYYLLNLNKFGNFNYFNHFLLNWNVSIYYLISLYKDWPINFLYPVNKDLFLHFYNPFLVYINFHLNWNLFNNLNDLLLFNSNFFYDLNWNFFINLFYYFLYYDLWDFFDDLLDNFYWHKFLDFLDDDFLDRNFFYYLNLFDYFLYYNYFLNYLFNYSYLCWYLKYRKTLTSNFIIFIKYLSRNLDNFIYFFLNLNILLNNNLCRHFHYANNGILTINYVYLCWNLNYLKFFISFSLVFNGNI
jgi:hypothetical protein